MGQTGLPAAHGSRWGATISVYATAINVLAVAITAYAVWRCYIPGKMLVILCGIFAWMLILVLWLAKLCDLLWRRKLRLFASDKRQLLVAPAVFLLWLIAVTPLPEWAGFNLSKPAFQHLLHQPRSTKPPWQAGLYSVQDYAADENGGQYFVTSKEPDMVDTISSGYAFRPSTESSPFGQKNYACLPLGGDWYIFSANNDY